MRLLKLENKGNYDLKLFIGKKTSYRIDQQKNSGWSWRSVAVV